MSLSTSPAPAGTISPATESEPKASYSPHLDSLRALAIIGVMLEHFGLGGPALLRCGPLSVRFFFVLSGYFITLSLWRVRTEIGQNGNASYVPLYRYYLARLMRIGPPFYMSLFIGAVFGIEEVRSNFLWLATFQTNTYILFLGYWPNAISHYWSLAVQEQFYLLWPALILTLPRRWFVPAMAAFIVFGLAFRLICIATEAAPIARWVTLIGCIDSFAVGALIAYVRQARLMDRFRTLPRVALAAMPLAAFACFFLGRALMTLPEDNLWLALTETCDAIFLAWLLTSVALGRVTGIYAAFLSWAPLVYLGRISYGIYVYHVFIIVIMSPLLVSWGFSEDQGSYVRLAILFTTTIMVASLSWHWLEQPFIAWKKSLTERRPNPLAPDVASAITR